MEAPAAWRNGRGFSDDVCRNRMRIMKNKGEVYVPVTHRVWEARPEAGGEEKGTRTKTSSSSTCSLAPTPRGRPSRALSQTERGKESGTGPRVSCVLREERGTGVPATTAERKSNPY